jgi:hypothetical protein
MTWIESLELTISLKVLQIFVVFLKGVLIFKQKGFEFFLKVAGYIALIVFVLAATTFLISVMPCIEEHWGLLVTGCASGAVAWITLSYVYGLE